MRVHTSRFGDVEVNDEEILSFPAGIIGFPTMTRYTIWEHDGEAPFRWLQSLDDGDLAFIVMDPTLVKPDYRIAIAPRDIAELGEGEGAKLIVLLILTVPSQDPGRITANLRGPVVINLSTKLGKQFVLSEDHPTRFPLFPDGAPPREETDPVPAQAGRIELAPVPSAE